jgi:hypothetical protein
MSERDETPGFQVRDRRRFDASGEARPDEAPARPEGTVPLGAARAAEDAVKSGPRGPDPEREPAPVNAPRTAAPIDFVTFVFSLGSSALMHLGDAPNPETGRLEKNLPLAQETIDLLAMLQGKTQGNLTPEEERFLGGLLYDLRLRFIEAAKAH